MHLSSEESVVRIYGIINFYHSILYNFLKTFQFSQYLNKKDFKHLINIKYYMYLKLSLKTYVLLWVENERIF